MADRPLPDSHLGTLWQLKNKGPTSALRKGEIGPLLNRGLVEPASSRGQYGMTYYRLTEAGHAHAEHLAMNPEGRGYVFDEAAAAAEKERYHPTAVTPEGGEPRLMASELDGLSIDERRAKIVAHQEATRAWRAANPEE